MAPVVDFEEVSELGLSSDSTLDLGDFSADEGLMASVVARSLALFSDAAGLSFRDVGCVDEAGVRPLAA